MLRALRHHRFRKYAAARFESFERGAHQPEKAFTELWKDTYSILRRGLFWEKRGLSETLENNPTTDYEDYRPSFEEAFSKTISPINGETILSWIVSSGSSGPPKKYPMTHSYKEQVHDFHIQFFYNYLSRYPRFLQKPLFYLAAHGPMAYSPSGVPVSYISNYNYLNMPPRIQQFYGVPSAVLRDDETASNWRSLYLLASDGSAFMSATPSVVVALLRQMESRGLEYLEILAAARPWPTGLSSLKIPRARLRQLEAAGVGKGGGIDFAKVWPGMAFVGCWTDAVCKLQAEELRRVLGPKIPVVEMPFSASEAWATIPLSPTEPGGAIHAESLLVEFGPVGEKDPARLWKPWELTVGTEYELYVTNRMGLVRYRMYDIVRCVGYYRNVAEISFVRKASQEISLGLVCISETELVRALESVDALRGRRTFFSPSATGRGLTLFVESKEEIASEIANQVFENIAAQNPLYRSDVEQGALAAIDVQAINPEHSIWKLAHAQSKPYLIRHTRPEL